ncbi:uncharacterized protein TNCV_1248551 [Trichonephila clavipes]|nr:uncharacterized protein TNCV_1248551 [Trichonephila clavipes]
MKIGNNGNLVLGPFDESTPCLMIVLMNCQTKLRINHLTAVKSVAILETETEHRKGERNARCDLTPVPLRYGSTLNSRRAASPLVRLVEGKVRWQAPDHPEGVLSLHWSGTEQNRIFIYMVLKAKADDRRKNLALHHDEFHEF